MPKYYCDYCDTYLTHDSPSVRKTHCQGRKHKDNVKFYYQKWMEEQAQHLIDATTAAFKAGKIANPFAPKPGAAIPPPANMQVSVFRIFVFLIKKKEDCESCDFVLGTAQTGTAWSDGSGSEYVRTWTDGTHGTDDDGT